VNLDSQAAAKKGPGGFAATTGQWTIHQLRGLIQLISVAVAVIWQSLQPLTWRRTVRAEFFQQCYLVGLRALPFILITGSLVGLGMVYQAIYWLGVFGQTEFTGPILVLVLVREVAPLFVALTVVGRSGSGKSTLLLETLLPALAWDRVPGFRDSLNGGKTRAEADPPGLSRSHFSR